MNPYQQKKRWKYSLLAFATVIAAGSLLYTQFLVRNIAKAERSRAQVWAMSERQVLASDDNDFLNYVFAVIDSTVVPAIVTDEQGDIQFSRGLDTTKTYIKLQAEGNKKLRYDPKYFQSELADMKKQHEPIKLTVLKQQWFVYYKDSYLLTQLKFFPYIQLSLIAIFLLMAYTAFSSSRKSEQDQVWVGLAKETAHQLGTPISSLMAWIELIKEKFDAEKDPLISEMENDVKRLEIVADRFSKIGSRPRLEDHNVYDVVKEFVDYFRIRVSKNISFEMTGNPHLQAGINIPLFDWVLENLLKNAVNAIEGKGIIKVDISGNKTKKQVFIDISDTGKGISRSKFDTIFQPGYTTRKRGWGLGLSLTRRIVENYHSGQVFVRESEPGKGSTFRIILKTYEMIERPQPDEYSAFAARYVDLVGNGPIIEILEYLQQMNYNFFLRMDPEKASYAYAEGKWTVKQVLGHMADTERVFAFRALAFSREAIELPGFDQDVYMEKATFNERTLEDIAEEFRTVRESTLYLLKSLTEEQTKQKGIASGNPVSVRALAYMIAGHEMHHIKILKERYL